MQVFRADRRAPEGLRGATAALGNLDGVHLGHQAVLGAAREAARGPLAAVVFDPHPREYFRSDGPPFRLQTSGQRARRLAAHGVEILFELPFDLALSRMSPADFVGEALAERLGLAGVAVGEDFRFGKDRAGDAAALAALCREAGLEARVAAPVATGEGAKISSSMARDAIRAGDLAAAERVLTRPFAIEGAVIAGHQRGRTIGFPTANVGLGAYVRPKFGVYAVEVDLGDGALRRGVANVGVKPTVGGAPEPLLETHVFDFEGDLYGRTIEVALRAFLREERRFESFEALVAQIGEDAQRARALLMG